MIGKRVLVIGGSSGIGLSLTSKLLSEGSEVVIASRNIDKLEVAKNEFAGKISSYQLDASDEQSVIRFFKEIGGFDCLVSTIKPDHLISDFTDSNVEDAKRAFDAKFWGQYQLIRHSLNTISKDGCIVLTSGIASNRGYRGFSGTAAINGAIESLVGSLSVELAPIRVNAVSPGFIERFGEDSERLSLVNDLGSRIPLKRLGTHDEASESYLYLLKNKYTTGTILKVDGGELCA